MYSRKSLLDHWERLLLASGVDSPRLSAQVLLAHILGISRLDMLLDSNSPVEEIARKHMELLGARRAKGEPVAYLTGSKEFYGLDFEVSPQVLIPRPETELILDHMRTALDENACLTALDIGTGSGALGVSCAMLFLCFRVVAVDISFEALKIARRNAEAHDVAARISFIQGDLVQALRISSFDVVMANLPYVPLNTKNTLSPEVLCHEPHGALFSGFDGLDCYRALAESMAGRMKAGALLWCEIDCSQGAAMTELFSASSKSVQILKDYAGHDRVAAVVF
ncbi:MAG: peptide chain release factor N(5)-glutamine methyltransferase [Desulfomicrobium sp.]|nr:peptide chain release factor N(5)-glutamine methyltransferase [Pseudomonadota bacterium]MBV1712265.1 peptide chain release factor N(5)-glutamine methyltransferase [Desulfomicrobium sp.]MBV1718463.1 peptide chain release factor N(5)-glutamine methyltransferase [Desulfomicrobium sp.]MBV1748989.1 peptide chain release factor N(5)-glutamine methyltransferase [Desulfomicrobium sp.]